MTYRALRFAVAAVALSTAACSDKSPSPLAPKTSAAVVATAPGLPTIHVMQTRPDATNSALSFSLNGGSTISARSSRGGTGISFHGGSVLQAGTKVAAVYWAGSPIYNNGPATGFGAGSADNSIVGYFLNHLGGSPYFNINATYTNGSTAIVPTVAYTQYWANGTGAPAAGANVTDAQMLTMLQTGFNTPNGLTYDASTLYIIFTPGTVNLGGGFGTQYCAYHWYGTVTVAGVPKTVLYSAMPYTYAYPSACTNQTASPNSDPAADAEVNVVAHEIEETTTDMFGTAWYDSRGYENADKCAWNFGATSTAGGGVWNITVGSKNFLVQQNWVNSGSGGCRQHWP